MTPFTLGSRFVPTTRQLNAWNRSADPAAQLLGGDRGPGVAGDPDRAFVRNRTGSTLPLYSVVCVKTPLVTPTADADRYKSLMAFNGDPLVDDDEQRIAILQQQLPPDQSDPLAIVAGVAHARLTGPADKKFATTKSGQYTLEAADSGPCVILYDPGPANEERIARVRIGGGGGKSCETKIKLLVMGFPTSGNLTLPVSIAGVPHNVVIAMPASATDVIAAFEAHPSIPAGSVHVDIRGATLPYAEATISFAHDAVPLNTLLIDNWTHTMTGGPHAAYAVISYCC